MRTRMIKTIARALAAALMLTDCGQTKDNASNQSSEAPKESSQVSSQTVQPSSEEAKASSYFNETGYPIVNEEITIKVLALKHASVTDFDNLADSPAWKYISEVTGVKFEFEEYLKQLNLDK